MTNGTRWGIISTAHIVEGGFLPGLRAAGGHASVVAGRDQARTEKFAQKNGIPNAIAGYQALLDDPEIDAVYIGLPNSLHAEWTIKALQAGKAVLCEKPLCGDVTEAQKVLEVARTSQEPLWEAFVFPFLRQQARLLELMETGAIGALQEIQSEFHFLLRDRTNIRLSPQLGGGGLNDVGCYPIRFAQLVFGSRPKSAVAVATWAPEGVDEDMQGILEYESGQRLLLSCGIARDSGTFTRLIGDEGEIRLTSPFHPRPTDTMEVRSREGVSVESLGNEEPTFTDAIRHIDAVLAETEKPRHTALDDSLGTEIALDLLHRAARSHSEERES